jgi:DNA-binding NtrC family response regulator/pSer/pThr/pTyr-binding forkhead associated (FHA) protein
LEIGPDDWQTEDMPMVTLAIDTGSGSELTYQVGKEEISVGASSRNDVVLRAPGVAPAHLVIRRNGDVFTFLGQQRQVVVLNGERRSRGVLRLGDRIRIGTATLVFRGEEEGKEAEDANAGADITEAEEPSVEVQSAESIAPRAEVVLFSEPKRLAEGRRHLVEVFGAKVRSDLVPSLRTFLATFFPERQALLAWLDENGSFQPIASQWSGKVPRLPARTFEEFDHGGRFGVLRRSGREVLIYPVPLGGSKLSAFVLAETSKKDFDEDRDLLAEFARMLAVHWERVESSSSLFGPWELEARREIESRLPGTSQAVLVLRDQVTAAARSSDPVLLSGRTGSGRAFISSLVASLRPTGESPVHMVRGRDGDESVLRGELFGSADTSGVLDVVEHAGEVIVLRDIQQLPATIQREIAAAIGEDLESGYGPKVRWIATTEEDCMGLVAEGGLDATLFNLFQRHLIRVPSLDERREDLPLIIVRLLEVLGSEQGKEIRGIELETLNSLLNHPFEGQMMELIGELRRLVSATPEGEMVRGSALPREIVEGMSVVNGGNGSGVAAVLGGDDLKQVLPAVEQMIIDRVLRRALGNQSKAARELNLSRGSLIAKIKEYGIPDYRSLRRNR